MATKMRRFTISITPDMDMELEELKQGIYSMNTQNEMIRDLLKRGLQNVKSKKEDRNRRQQEPL